MNVRDPAPSTRSRRGSRVCRRSVAYGLHRAFAILDPGQLCSVVALLASLAARVFEGAWPC